MPFVSPDLIRTLGYLLLFLLVAPLFPFIYVVLRWRAGGAAGLGTYSALLYFRSAAILLALAGAANLTYGWLSTTEIDEALTRLSWGMLTGSLAFLAINLALLRMHAGREGLADARRVFHGFVMVVAGLVAFTALVTFCITLFGKAENERAITLRTDQLKIYGSWTGYYLATYLFSSWWLARAAQR